jgi:DNA-binding transcriptional LysR family regulator
MNLDETAAFVAVVLHGGFAAAGRQLDMPRSTLSRQIQRLEQRIGVRLLQRTTRHIGLTSAGERYYARCRSAVEAIVEAERAVAEQSTEPRGTLRIATVNLSTLGWMMDGVADFRLRYPDIELVFDMSHRRADIIAEGVDVAIRGGVMDDSSLIARKLIDSSLLLYASPEYLRRQGRPRSIAQLSEHRGVLLTPSGPLCVSGPEGAVELSFGAVMRANDMPFVRGMVIRGMGIGLLEDAMATPAVRAGQLVQVLPDYGIIGPGGLFVVYPSRQHVPAKVRAFVDFIVAHAAAHNPLLSANDLEAS